MKPWDHPDVVRRFLSRLRLTDGECIEIAVAVNDKNERGSWRRFRANGFPGCPSGRVYAHRYAYALFRGPIPEAHDLDHMCRNTSCVNPYHLRPLPKVEHAVQSNANRWEDPDGCIGTDW